MMFEVPEVTSVGSKALVKDNKYAKYLEQFTKREDELTIFQYKSSSGVDYGSKHSSKMASSENTNQNEFVMVEYDSKDPSKVTCAQYTKHNETVTVQYGGKHPSKMAYAEKVRWKKNLSYESEDDQFVTCTEDKSDYVPRFPDEENEPFSSINWRMYPPPDVLTPEIDKLNHAKLDRRSKRLNFKEYDHMYAFNLACDFLDKRDDK